MVELFQVGAFIKKIYNVFHKSLSHEYNRRTNSHSWWNNWFSVIQYACHGPRSGLSRTGGCEIIHVYHVDHVLHITITTIWTMEFNLISRFRDWSLITGRGGGATKREGGGAREVLPLRKGEMEKVLAMLKGGGGGNKKFWGSFYAVA